MWIEIPEYHFETKSDWHIGEISLTIFPHLRNTDGIEHGEVAFFDTRSLEDKKLRGLVVIFITWNLEAKFS